MGDLFEAVTDFQEEEFSFEWRITSWKTLKWFQSPAYSPTFRRNSLEVKFEIHFSFDGYGPSLTSHIRVLTSLGAGRKLVLSSSCLQHGKSHFNFEHRLSSNHRREMNQNVNVKAERIKESDIIGEEIKLEAHFVVTEIHSTIIENCEQVKDNVSISTDSEKQLCEDLAKLICSSLHSDFEIKVQDSTFKGHKAIFAARSPVFAAMFEHPMKEASSGCVNIEDTDATTWQRFQNLLYSGRVSLEECSVEEHGNIIALADKYQVKTLLDDVAHNLKKMVTVDNFFDAADVACKFDLTDVQLHLTNIYRRNRKYFKSEAIRSEIVERRKKNPNLVNIVWAES